MTFKDRLIDFCLIALALIAATLMLWYGFTITKPSLPLPQIVKDSLPFQPRQIAPMQVELVTPFPNEENVSTYPTISLQSQFALGKNVSTKISPSASFKASLSKDNLLLTLSLTSPLKPRTLYVVTVTDPTTLTTYNWAFKTGNRVIDASLAKNIAKLNQSLPFRDPQGRFTAYYAPQTDRYFITVHDDERSIAETEAAYQWIRSFGIASTNDLQITVTPSLEF